MEKTNLFKLDLTNKWAKDFYEDHNMMRVLYVGGYELLQNAPEPDEHGNQPKFEQRAAHFATMATYSVKFSEACHNLLISHAAFKAQAEKDEATMKEFKKIPGNFSEVSSALNEMQQNFTLYFESLKDTI